MGAKAIWRHFHRFVLWLPVASPAAYAAIMALIAAAAQANNHQANVWLDNQINMWAAILSAPYLPIWITVLVALWLAAFLWSGHKMEETANRPLAGRGDDLAPASSGMKFHSTTPARKIHGHLTKDDLAYWSNTPRPLEIWQVAYLWLGCRPPEHYSGSNIPPFVLVEMEKLERALAKGMLTATDENARHLLTGRIGEVWRIASNYVAITRFAEVTHDALRTYAESIGERPAFLFQSRD